MTQTEQREKDFFSPVKKVPAKDILGKNYNTTERNSHCIVVDIDGGGHKIVNFCSKVYGLVENSKIFPEIEKMLSEKYTFSKKYTHRDHSKFYADYLLKGKDTIIGHAKFDDKIQPLIRIMHSYNGQLKYSAQMGFKRQICSNGLWGYVFETQIDLRHNLGNLSKIFEGTMKGVDEFLKQSEKFKLVYQVLADRQIKNVEHRVDEVINAVKLFPKRQRAEVIERINIEHKDNNLPITDWLVYNAFNYQLNHNTSIKQHEDVKMTTDKKVFEFMHKNEPVLL